MNTTRYGFFWSAFDRVISQAIQLIVLIALARLLEPESFGLMAMTYVLVALANTFIDSGFYNSLVRKANPTDSDYSTVFYVCIFIGMTVYAFSYFLSSHISSFYDEPILTDIIKTLSIVFVMNSLTTAHRAKLVVNIQFKRLSFINVIAVTFGGIVGLLSAMNGHGVWSLVYQTISNAFMMMVLNFTMVKISYRSGVSLSSFKDLFSYGYKLFLSNLIEVIYSNSYILLIGKLFNSHQLGLYYQANRLIEIFSNTYASIISRVNLPLLSQEKLEENKIKMFENTISLSMFVFLPICCILILSSNFIFVSILGSQWEDSALYFDILVVAYSIFPLHVVNLNVLQMKKRSDLYLRLEIGKKLVGILVLALSYRFGVLWMCVGITFTSFLCLWLNTIYTKSIFGKGLSEQLLIIKDSVIASIGPLLLILLFLKIDFFFSREIFMVVPVYIFLWLALYYYLNRIMLFNTMLILLGKTKVSNG
ncbi:lipopolysaccharide biosynthesis protein wzxC [Vibrio ishigakensis]|uniref:Lipopolysaccharide biosynthesis protein wzxC n=1 Tax=Vibrio ishigakensis TaxID=1481914 RepID=A0A0B8NQR8_9VIBR|nr:lipopolysaccharide biosynthesis protein [Vibrio ishigakensis]GAM56910.1 lipopolysaccharide biosynthesis protein wzxC [Vibrio ishigakensis]